MRVEDDGQILVFKFIPVKRLIIDRNKKILKFGKWTVPFSQVKGYWKNHRIKGGRMVYYVMLLTGKRMDRITPEIDEYDADEVLNYLKKEIKLEVKK